MSDGTLSVSIIIPWLDRGDPERARIAEFVIDYYWGLDIGEVVIGRYDDDGGPLNRSRLRNEGAKKATGDVLFFVDADILLPGEQVREAVRLAAEAPGAVLPCDIFLTDARDNEVDEILGGADFREYINLERPTWYSSGQAEIPDEWHVGSSYAIRREDFWRLDGFDENFAGWGEEDKDFLVRAKYQIAPMRLVHGGLLHLGEHLNDRHGLANTPGTPEHEQFQRNRQRFIAKYNALRPVKIAVFAPAKNEEANVKAWAKSAKGADEIVLVDTGSTDDTLRIARALERKKGAKKFRVETAVVTPWRFDDGFNAALSQVSADIDIAVPLHLDERLQPGWREELEAAWRAGGRQFTFIYDWGQGLTYRHDRIHARKGYRWVGAAHEYPSGPGPRVDTNLRIVQTRDDSKDRSQDDALIELAWRENPTPRTTYYWARQLYYRNRWDDARTLLQRYLAMPDATYDQERAEACRFMSRMVFEQYQEAWLLRACSESPGRRECWWELATWYSSHGMPAEAAGPAARALRITEQTPANSFHLEVAAWLDEPLRDLIDRAHPAYVSPPA